jgi:hypothetical protein
VRRRTADGGGSPAVPTIACWNSQAISSLVACRAASALPDSAQPSRSVCSVQRAIYEEGTASSFRPIACSPARYAEKNCDKIPPHKLRPHAPLAQPPPQVDLLGPEILRPHMAAQLIQESGQPGPPSEIASSRATHSAAG